MPTQQMNCKTRVKPSQENDSLLSNRDTNQMLRQTVVIIPARDEEASIRLVLEAIPPVAYVVVVNNGSTDNTAQIAEQCGAMVIDVETPGYGRACRVGIHAARRLRRRRLTQSAQPVTDEIRYIAFLDGDYSDFPEQLPTLLGPIHRDEADFVLGSRLLGEREPGAMPPQSVYGNWLACTLIRWIWGYQYSDLGPFRVIRFDALDRLQLKDTNFGWTVEMQIKAVRHHLRILEVPVRYRCRIGVSKISGTFSGTIRAGYKILATIARYALLPN